MNGSGSPEGKIERRPRHPRGALAAALIAALGTALGVAAPAGAVTEYLGGGFLVMGNGCARYGWTGTHQVMMRLEPQGVGGNPDTETQMSLLLGTGTIALRVNIDRGIRHVYSPSQAVYVWNGPYAPAQPGMTLSFGMNGTWVLGGGAELRRVQIRFGNFNEHDGCNAVLNATLVRN